MVYIYGIYIYSIYIWYIYIYIYINIYINMVYMTFIWTLFWTNQREEHNGTHLHKTMFYNTRNSTYQAVAPSRIEIWPRKQALLQGLRGNGRDLNPGLPKAWTQTLGSSDHLHVAAENFGATWRSFTWAYNLSMSEDTLSHGGIIILILTWYIGSAHEISLVFSSRRYTFQLKSNYDIISSGSEVVTLLQIDEQ